MDDTHAMIAKAALWQRCVDLGLVTNQKNIGEVFVVLKGPLGAFNDHAAPVVATHDIHSNSHIWTERRMGLRESEDQVPAVTVMTWRPL